ncbi:MAG: aspartate dehydrogenase [Candidatus Omnitrophica bacterium]|nr:aspartate dehydrogenase [Candidatus Omnitrophota bacterium]
MRRLKVGIIGCGTIGSEIAKACQDRLRDKINLIGIYDIDKAKSLSLSHMLKKKAPILKLDNLIKKVDMVIEAASAAVSASLVEKAIKTKKDIFIMSVGGLLGKESLLRLAEKRGINVYLPSGAICGIDGLKAGSIGRIDSVTLTTKKPPKGLEGAPYLKKNRVDLSRIKEETLIFEGSAADAVANFPQNVNVCAVLSLAGIGADKTRVRIITSPDYTKNIHEVEMTGDFGKILTRTENVPSRTNPKTSALAIMSAIATLEGIVNNVKIGT